MKLSEVKTHLEQMTQVNFQLPDGNFVPKHFHVTEIGMITKHYIDCGGTIRTEQKINFQLWEANDYDHRLNQQKLMDIIELSEKSLHMPDLEVEVEYQSDTIARYGLNVYQQHFVLESLQTDCLAKDKCGIPPHKQKIKISELANAPTANTSCDPNSGCC